MKVLFVVPPLTGHTNPTVAVGSELLRRGHDVMWCGDRRHLETHLGVGIAHRIIPACDDLPDDLVDAISSRSHGLRGAAALKFLWEDFLEPLARATVDGIDAAAREFEPDVIVVDQQAVAGAVVARRLEIPWLTSATTSADLVDPFEGLPKLREWVDAKLTDFQIGCGVAPADALAQNLRFSPYGVLAFTTEALAGPLDGIGVPVTCTGPAFLNRPTTVDFPWEFLDGRPLIFVSLGTVNASVGQRFFQAAADAIGERPGLQAVIVCDESQLSHVPSNVLCRSRVPQIEVLKQCAAVVGHGGHNTVCEALAAGLPLVVAPIRDDQPVVAAQVEAAGAGIRIKFSRTNAALLGTSIDAVLSDGSFRANAERVGESFVAAGGAGAAADAVERVGRTHHAGAPTPGERTPRTHTSNGQEPRETV